MKTIVLSGLAFLKALIILFGLSLTLWYLIKGFTNKDANGTSKALKYFLGTVGITIAISISILEFAGLLNAS